MGRPVFSVVIPLFNSAPFVSGTIESVLAQDFVDFEVLIIDDGSTDDSLSVVKKINDDRIHIIEKGNTGVSDTRNVGCRRAKGEYIAFLDSDDYWYPDHLSEALAFFEKHPDVPWYGAAQFHIPYGSFIQQRQAVREFAVREFFRDGKSYVHSSSLIIRRNLFEESGGYPEDMKHFEDNVFQSQIGLRHPLIGTNERVTSIYFRREGSASSKTDKDMPLVFERLVRIHAEALKQHPVDAPNYSRRIFREFLKASLFHRTAEEMQTSLDTYGFILSPSGEKRWRDFIRRAYTTAIRCGITDELGCFVSMPLKGRIKRARKLLLDQGLGAAFGWMWITALYAMRGWADLRETN